MYKAVKGTTQTINLKNATPAALLMVESKEEGANIYIDGENKGNKACRDAGEEVHCSGERGEEDNP